MLLLSGMSVRHIHDDSQTLYFCTFTCYNWLPLFEIVNGYDLVYKWFDVMKTKGYEVAAYVIMPNHIHVIIHFPDAGYDLNKIISNAKRFMAYEIVRRLKERKRVDILAVLAEGVRFREHKKGQLHKVFRDSFDAKGLFSPIFYHQKLEYIHMNPVRGKWSLVADYTKYPHSSASFYELGEVKLFKPVLIRLY